MKDIRQYTQALASNTLWAMKQTFGHDKHVKLDTDIRRHKAGDKLTVTIKVRVEEK